MIFGSDEFVKRNSVILWKHNLFVYSDRFVKRNVYFAKTKLIFFMFTFGNNKLSLDKTIKFLKYELFDD